MPITLEDGSRVRLADIQREIAAKFPATKAGRSFFRIKFDVRRKKKTPLFEGSHKAA